MRNGLREMIMLLSIFVLLVSLSPVLWSRRVGRVFETHRRAAGGSRRLDPPYTLSSPGLQVGQHRQHRIAKRLRRGAARPPAQVFDLVDAQADDRHVALPASGAAGVLVLDLRGG